MSAPVRFDRPPIAEVACGLLFNPVGLKTVHIGQLWEIYRKEFPRAEEAAPINAVIEPSGLSAANKLQVGFMDIPDLRRSWFLDAEGRHLIQIQADRFLFNWKREVGTDQYPSFESVFARFEKYLGDFAAFLKEHRLGELVYRQFELTYVNLIGKENGLSAADEGRLLADHLRNASPNRFLPLPEKFSLNTSYLLPSNCGRLHITAQTAMMQTTREKVIRMELIARGLPADRSEENRKAWFEMAHEWITHGFADSTTPELHKLWKRTS